MIRIEPDPWQRMVAHARSAYPNECCGAMLGETGNGDKTVRAAVPMDNVFQGERRERYELRPEDLLDAERQAREAGMELIGIFHSHPDCDAYFSETDLKNSCPWFSFVVLSIKNGELDHAGSFLPNLERTEAVTEELSYPG